MTDHGGTRAARAQRDYDDALSMNPYLDHATKNNCLARIAEAAWMDRHNGTAPGFERPAPTFTRRDDFGNLPFRVLHWAAGHVVKAQDFWTGNRANLFAAWAIICEREIKMMYHPPLAPQGLMLQTPCWHPHCVMSECLGVAHCDPAGNVWEQPPRSIWNEAAQQWHLPGTADRLAAP